MMGWHSGQNVTLPFDGHAAKSLRILIPGERILSGWNIRHSRRVRVDRWGLVAFRTWRCSAFSSFRMLATLMRWAVLSGVRNHTAFIAILLSTCSSDLMFHLKYFAFVVIEQLDRWLPTPPMSLAYQFPPQQFTSVCDTLAWYVLNEIDVSLLFEWVTDPWRQDVAPHLAFSMARWDVNGALWHQNEQEHLSKRPSDRIILKTR